MDQLDELGWVKLDAVLDARLVNDLVKDFRVACDKTREIRASQGQVGNSYGTVNHLLSFGSSFQEFLERRYCDSLISEFFKGKYILNIFGGVNLTKEKTSYVRNVHRDLRSFSGDNHVMLQLLVMLHDFTPENGATYVLSGSHKREMKPNDVDFFKCAEQLVGKAGDIVLFNSNLWHAAGENTTEGDRVGLTLAYTKPYFKPQLDYVRFFGDKIYTFSEHLKQLFGLYSQVPLSLEEWYVDSSERKYKKDQG
ncbi:hypothetical protein BIY24_01755 [Halobacteriovorax marinus]|nr:hypothetical protein BIY24_01755 [Halobacteriovorax marinus]